MILTPSPLATFTSPTVLPSMSNISSGYSTWVVAMGWTACVLQTIEIGISESPRCLTLSVLLTTTCSFSPHPYKRAGEVHAFYRAQVEPTLYRIALHL